MVKEKPSIRGREQQISLLFEQSTVLMRELWHSARQSELSCYP